MKITITIFSLLGTLCLFEASSASASTLRTLQRNMQEEEECRPRLWEENGPVVTGSNLSEFGEVDIANDGMTMAVTAEADIEPTSGNKTGSLRVYRMNPIINEWEQVGETIYGTVDDGKFGKSVAIGRNGRLIAVGATGSVSVFSFVGNSTYSLVGGQAITDELPGFGSKVTISRDARLLVVGNGQADLVVIFSIALDDSALSVIQVIQRAPTTKFGSALSISEDGSTLAVGAPGTECNVGIGITVIYTRQPDGQFAEFQILTAADSGEFGDAFGNSVDISFDGRLVAVGDVGAGEFGAAMVFLLSRGEYVQIGQMLKGDSGFTSFGYNVALNREGNVLAVASPDGTGGVRAYRLVELTTWIRVGQELSGDMEGDQFGSALSLSSNGNVMAVGIEGADSVMVYAF